MTGQTSPAETNSAAMVLLTYTPGPAAVPAVYEDWLRREDNPTFNRIPGIGEYSNWKVIAPDPAGLPWSHFDFFGLAAAERLHAVWYHPELERFRKGWVARWGYGATGPSPVNANGHLCRSEGAPIAARQRYVAVRLGDGIPGDADETWAVTGTVRKHYAIGPAPAGEPWPRPIAAFNPLGCTQLGLRFLDAPPAQAAWTSTHLLAECIAAPSLARL